MSKKINRPNRIKKERFQRKKRRLRLGGYLVVTDASETEPNYFKRIRDSFPESIRVDLQLKIYANKDLSSIIDFAIAERNNDERFRNIWLIFDKDEFEIFDQIIDEADTRGLNVGWSNPCFEIWLSAYFGEIKYFINSRNCCNNFKKLLKKHANKEINYKSDEKLYEILTKYGCEKKAIQVASERYNNFSSNCKKPSKMHSCTTVFKLVEEIRQLIDYIN